MRFGLLGAVTVNGGGVGSAKARALLATLLSTPGRVVTPETLKAAMWGEDPPATATASLHNHVARLRRLLAEDGRDASRLRAVPPGYVLEVAAGELDAAEFVRHHAEARTAHRAEDWPAVQRECAAALALWRGDPLADVPALSDPMRAYAAHLAEARLQALEWRFDAELALGRHQGMTAELAALTAAHPLREPFHRQWMLALHRTHRQAEALAAFHDLRRTLVDELGVEPGPAVQAAYHEVLAAAPEEPQEQEPVSPPAQLPADTGDFTGRGGELAALLAAIRPHGPDAPRVAVVTGMGGIGKTALAVHAAHLARADFPDGVLYVDLRGFGAGQPRRPRDLLARFLGDLCTTAGSGTGTAQPLPDDQDDLSSLLRQALHGRRVLLVLDNAADAAQVVPLLPGRGDSAVIVTSRRTLADLPGAVRLPLEPLGAEEQHRLLVAVCGPSRVAAEPDAAAGVLAACGGLPLALRIAGARLAARPNWPLTALAERLDSAGDRLHALAAGGLAVQDTFAMSYLAMRDSPQAADREAARAFRLLGLWPGHPLAHAPAAALLGREPAAAEDLLEALVDTHLLQTPQPGRYRFHDLLGEYAAGRAAEEVPPRVRENGLRRLLVWYVATVAGTAELLAPEGHPIPPLHEQPAVPPREFSSEEAALRWCVKELPAIKEAVRQAAAHGWSDVAWRLAAGLFGYAQAYWWTGEWETCLLDALACAEETGDVQGRAWMHSRLGVSYGMSDRVGPCLEHLEVARLYFETAGDLQGQAAILNNLSGLHRALGDNARALEYGRKSLDLHYAVGDADRVATVLGNLGDAHLGAGDSAAAIACYRRALAMWRERGVLTSTARSLTSLGEALRTVGRYDEAVAALEETVLLLDRIGDRGSTADTLEVLGRTHYDRGDLAAARKSWERALELARAHCLEAKAEAVLAGLARLDADDGAATYDGDSYDGGT
ncbi:AfsR/SARP family transcriptional regulator [Actinacidiphila alni]|uniref:AfsR/SARP family transcriptional regulator n=1 Tax=Actinacidiphila alni TaxID=380248 RepID=UPI003451F1F0